MKKAFTLLELLLVIAIMGMMGTVSVGAYRAMQRGMEERGVVQNANEFFRLAFERSQIDHTPVAIYMWNETISSDEDDDNATLTVVGRAVAVRGFGRITRIQGNFLIDEFGDLAASATRKADSDTDEIDYEDTAGSGNSMYLYRMRGNDISRTLVDQSTISQKWSEPVLTEGANQASDSSSGGTSSDSLRDFDFAFAYLTRASGDWKVGDRYGLEFAQISLPHNYIFGSSYSRSAGSPEQEVGVCIMSEGNINGGAVQLSAIRQGKSGDMTTYNLGTIKDPKSSRSSN